MQSVVNIKEDENTINFEANNHSVFVLNYHLIMCVKCCNKVMDDEISKWLREMFAHISPKYHSTLEEWSHDVDYVHILLRGQLNTEISKFINAYNKK